MAETLTQNQIAEFREEFSLMDNDSDGLMTMEEIRSIVKSLDEHPSKEEIQDMINKVHCDANEMINFDEFLSIMGTKMKDSVGEELTEAFKVFDRNQDGYITANELRQVLINFGERLTDDEAHQMITEADLDGDGQVNYEEFARIMTIS